MSYIIATDLVINLEPPDNWVDFVFSARKNKTDVPLCEVCGKPVFILYDICNSIPDLYESYIEPGIFCYKCLEAKEQKYIKSISVKDLPLFVNYVWLIEPSLKFYNKIMSEVST